MIAAYMPLRKTRENLKDRKTESWPLSRLAPSKNYKKAPVYVLIFYIVIKHGKKMDMYIVKLKYVLLGIADGL